MPKAKVKKNILTNSVVSSKDCYLCDTINLMHEHYNMPTLLRTVSQWDTEQPSQLGSIHHYKCFVCNYDSKHFKKWKTHIMSIEHVSKCHAMSNVSSYFCKTCKSLFYGSEMCICKHQKDVHCEKSNLSYVSIFVSELMNCLDSHSKHYYCCTLCKVISEKPIHTSGKHFKKQELYDCKYCNVSLLCNTEELDFHNMSVEHLTFKCIYLIKEATKQNSFKAQEPFQVTEITNDICTELNSLKLPLIILDRFQKTSKCMAKCKFCNVLVLWNKNAIVKHVHLCLNKDQLSSKQHELLIKVYDCRVCNFKTNSFFSYKLHVISPIHLKNSHACGDFYSYFCDICNLYMYGSKLQIKTHLQNNHKIDIIDLPFLSTVLKDNYKHISNHPVSDYIDYYDQQYCEEKCVPDQCYACKISFCMCNYEYNLHKISSEHIILKYFIPKNPSSVTTLTTNTNLIINKEALDNKFLSPIKIGNENSNNLEEMSINKGHAKTKKRKLSMNSSISENIKVLKTDNEQKSNLAIPSIMTNYSKHQKVFYTDDNAKMPDFNSNAEVHLTERVQGALHYVDLSTSSECSDDLSLKNIMDNKLKNNAVHQESFLENTNDIEYIGLTKPQVNIMSTETLSNITTVHKQLHPTDTDHAYGQYVIERLKNIQNPSLKSDIKLKIDALFCT